MYIEDPFIPYISRKVHPQKSSQKPMVFWKIHLSWGEPSLPHRAYPYVLPCRSSIGQSKLRGDLVFGHLSTAKPRRPTGGWSCPNGHVFFGRNVGWKRCRGGETVFLGECYWQQPHLRFTFSTVYWVKGAHSDESFFWSAHMKISWRNHQKQFCISSGCNIRSRWIWLLNIQRHPMHSWFP